MPSFAQPTPPPPQGSKTDIWLDGEMVGWEDARVSVLSHGIQRGALVFDVGRMRVTPDGVRHLFRPREHVARFLRSAELIGLPLRWDAAALLTATTQVASTASRDAPSSLVRWSAFIPSLEADVVPSAAARASVAIAVIRPEDSLPPGEPVPPRPAAARVQVPRDLRKAGPEVFPPQAKVAASYLGPMLAKRRARAEGFDEVVLLDREGRVAEAPTANVFVAKGGVLMTPPVERVLAGITRDSVLALARAEGLEVAEKHLSPEDLEEADEAFLTATSMPVVPIASFGGRALRAPVPGPLTARIRELVLACELGRDPRFASWTVEVP